MRRGFSGGYGNVTLLKLWLADLDRNKASNDRDKRFVKAIKLPELRQSEYFFQIVYAWSDKSSVVLKFLYYWLGARPPSRWSAAGRFPSATTGRRRKPLVGIELAAHC